MPYTGPEPARRPLSSDDITDGIVSTDDLADSAVTAAKVSSDVSQLGKNLFRNGEVSVDQREGDTRTGLGASGLYLADGWKYESSGSGETGRFTFSRGTGITGANKSLRFEVTTADASVDAGHIYQFTQKIEAQNLRHLLYGTASAKSVTFQAKIKSNWAGTMTMHIIAPDGSRSYATPLVVVGDESQETFTFTLPGDASGAINNDTGVGFDWMITLAGGSNFQGGTPGAWAASNNNLYAASNSGNFFDTISNYFEISLMQLEVGSVATDFEHEDYGTTLAKCQRYFERLDYNGASAESIGVGTAASTSSVICVIPYRRKKRALPTLTASAAATFEVIYAGGAVADIGTINSLAAGIEAITFVGTGVVGSPLTDGYSVNLRRDGTDTTYIDISAEL
jgi:hypothetical protein